jgi:hypothetical protein
VRDRDAEDELRAPAQRGLDLRELGAPVVLQRAGVGRRARDHRCENRPVEPAAVVVPEERDVRREDREVEVERRPVGAVPRVVVLLREQARVQRRRARERLLLRLRAVEEAAARVLRRREVQTTA